MKNELPAWHIQLGLKHCDSTPCPAVFGLQPCRKSTLGMYVGDLERRPRGTGPGSSGEPVY